MYARKKNVVGVLLIAIMLSLCCIFMLDIHASNVNAEDYSVFTFTPTSDTTCSVKLKDKTVDKALIPQKVIIDNNVYTVTSIAASGFSRSTNLENIRLPKTITAIGTGAFANCKKLHTITLPSVESIAANAFGMCTNLEYIILPDSVTTIGTTIFRSAPNVKVYARASEAKSGWASNWNMSSSGVYVDVEYDSNFNPDVGYEKVNVTTEQNIMPLAEIPGMDFVEDYYVVREAQEFDNEELDITIPATYRAEGDDKEYDVMRIANSAFWDNIFGTLTIEYSD